MPPSTEPDRDSIAIIDSIAQAIAGLPQYASGGWNADHDCFAFRLRGESGEVRGVLRSDGALSITTADDAHDEEASKRFVDVLRRLLGDGAAPLQCVRPEFGLSHATPHPQHRTGSYERGAGGRTGGRHARHHRGLDAA